MPPPLTGRRIVVTRAAEQAGELLERLRAEGAEAVALPTIAIAPPLNAAPLEAALEELATFDGCIFTSANAARAVLARAQVRSLAPPRGWICAVGTATAAALTHRAGWAATLLPQAAQAAGIAAALAAQPLAGKRIFFPRAEAAGELIPRVLSERGATVVSPVAYRTVLAESSRAAAPALFPGADAAVFTSPSTARNLAALLGEDHSRRMRDVRITVIGPVTATAVAQLGWQVTATAQQPDVESIIAALRSCWRA
ncbi:MAG: uroporphyrinogen-III synthase [Acidobacteria bacterium]|nr:MAG: uroporphyrinogen-III synthase [Acidobacteriota bacterium]